jgi:hypothetical protein
MATSNNAKKHKHFVLDQRKIDRAQQVLGANSEKETIELALEKVILEEERDRRAWQAHDRLLKSGIVIRDVYGVLSDDE